MVSIVIQSDIIVLEVVGLVDILGKKNYNRVKRA